jgi:hypothetical protein
MRTWPTLSERYKAPNGFVVEPVGSEEATQALGRFFRNGLMIEGQTNPYPGRCVRGDGQIIKVEDGLGNLVANGFLLVQGGQVTVSFLREHNNRDLIPAEPAFEAVASYAAAVNSKDRHLRMNLAVGTDSFSEAPAPEVPAWQQALASARAKFITPFMALVTGGLSARDDEPAAARPRLDPSADGVPDQSWTPLTAAWTHHTTGITVEPVSSRAGLRQLGESLDNNLQVMHGAAAHDCASGTTQFAAVYSEAGGILAMAEFRPVNGTVVPHCRGRFETAPRADVAAAVRAYTAAVNGGTLATNFPAGASTFEVSPDGPITDDVFTDFGNAGTDAGPTVPPASRTAGEWDGPCISGERDYPEDEAETGDLPATPLTWEPIADDFVSNGLRVKVVTDQETLRDMGIQFSNALEIMHGRWAADCASGDSQIVRIEDADGNMVGNAEIKAFEGKVYSPNGALAGHNAPAPEPVRAALADWIEAVNAHDIVLNGDIGDDGFTFPGGPTLCR